MLSLAALGGPSRSGRGRHRARSPERTGDTTRASSSLAAQGLSVSPSTPRGRGTGGLVARATSRSLRVTRTPSPRYEQRPCRPAQGLENALPRAKRPPDLREITRDLFRNPNPTRLGVSGWADLHPGPTHHAPPPCLREDVGGDVDDSGDDDAGADVGVGVVGDDGGPSLAEPCVGARGGRGVWR